MLHKTLPTHLTEKLIKQQTIWQMMVAVIAIGNYFGGKLTRSDKDVHSRVSWVFLCVCMRRMPPRPSKAKLPQRTQPDQLWDLSWLKETSMFKLDWLCIARRALRVSWESQLQNKFYTRPLKMNCKIWVIILNNFVLFVRIHTAQRKYSSFLSE